MHHAIQLTATEDYKQMYQMLLKLIILPSSNTNCAEKLCWQGLQHMIKATDSVEHSNMSVDFPNHVRPKVRYIRG